MRLTLVREGKLTIVDVAADGGSVTVDGRTYPVRVVDRTPTRIELEIDGEKAVVEGWPEPFAPPPTEAIVDGERWAVDASREISSIAPRVPIPTTVPETLAKSAPTPPGPARGTAIVPPMPGRVVELKVREGDRVRRGAVLLVLEAMKMRNEVTSPLDGAVRDLKVAEGSSVRAREPMLYVVPE